MTTQARVTANRLNSQKSTGPRTLEGKSSSSKNAIKHGLLSREVVLPDEDFDAFTQMSTAILEDMSPAGPLENAIAQLATAALWRLYRVRRIEAAIFQWLSLADAEDVANSEGESYLRDDLTRAVVLYNKTVTDTKRRSEAIQRAGRAGREQDGQATDLARRFIRDVSGWDSLEKLARYEKGLERTLFRALNELRTLHGERHG